MPLCCTLQVLRDCQRQTIPAEELVPGDVVLIKSGDKVPADLRLITSNNLQVCGLAVSCGCVVLQEAVGYCIECAVCWWLTTLC